MLAGALGAALLVVTVAGDLADSPPAVLPGSAPADAGHTAGGPATAQERTPGDGSRMADDTDEGAGAAFGRGADVAARTDLLALFALRARAEAGGDRRGWAATVLAPSSPRGRAEVAVLDRMRALRVAGLRYTSVSGLRRLDGAEAVPLAGGPDSAGMNGGSPTRWVARVEGRYTLAGVDRGPRRFTRVVEVVHTGTAWWVVGRAGPADVGAPTPVLEPWDLAGAAVVRGPHAVVVGAGGRTVLRSYLRTAERAAGRVTGLCGASRPGVAVLVPRGPSELAALLGGAEVDGEQVAALTVGDVPGGGTARSDRVIVNPAAFARLGPVGRRVVLTHEVTHLALRATVPGRPEAWLSEGLADVVGYRGTGLGDRRVAAGLLDQVRAGAGPRQLPGRAAFDSEAATIAPSYEASYLAVRLLERRYGIPGVCDLYRTAAGLGGPDGAGSADTAAAFRRALGTDEGEFTRSWRGRLAALARS